MSALMVGWHKAAGGGALAPRLITDRTLARLGLQLETKAGEWVATTLVHYGIGCTAAAAYQAIDVVLGRRLSRPGPAGRAVSGAGFGLLIWTLAYGAGIPALRLLSMIASRGEGGEVCVCELTPAFELSQPTISHHLKLLRQAGLIDCERRGTWVYYWATDHGHEVAKTVRDLA
jgi:DNA-binding transcriptional ArsR family regulator